MTKKLILKSIKQKFPEVFMLPEVELKLIKKALLYAAKMPSDEELLTKKEHDELMKELGPKGDITSASSLKAYRLRQELTQKELAAKSKIPQANISAMENGKRPIGLNIAKKLAKILKCDYKKLL